MYYNVRVLGLRLGDSALAFRAADWEASFGTILDSGTTFSFLPLQTVVSFEAQLRQSFRAANLLVVKRPFFRLCFQTYVASSSLNPLLFAMYILFACVSQQLLTGGFPCH
jgi:hypothetical protein